jgi:hypothetical protein
LVETVRKNATIDWTVKSVSGAPKGGHYGAGNGATLGC